MAPAASSRVANPSRPEAMKSRIRRMPAGLVRWVMSTTTRPAATVHEQHRPVAIIPPDIGDEMDALEPFESHEPWIHPRPSGLRLTRRSRHSTLLLARVIR